MAGAGYPVLDGSRQRNPLLEKWSFEQLQRNDIIETRPHILHFGGFQIHKVHTQVLHIVNISGSSIRVSIIGPSTQWFKIDFDKKGLLAPGMSEDITVMFEPHEWRYYYDTIQIFCGENAENLVVPIHGYPSANDIVLPRILDFGSVAIGTSRTKVIPLTCKVPIQFEFEVKILEASPDFEVSPLRGMIPAQNTVEIVIRFSPTKYRTSRMELQFSIAQFDFQPLTVSLVGSCLPDIMKNEVLNSAEAERTCMAARRNQEEVSTMVQTLKEKKSRKALKALEVMRPTFPQEETERSLQGLKVPKVMDQHATNFVLNQTAGKLPLKDLYAFIKEQREAAENRRRRAADHGASDDDVDEDEDEDRQATELRFELHYREVDKMDKEKLLKSHRATGEEPPSQEAAEKVMEARRKRHDRMLETRMENDAARVEAVISTKKVTVPCAFRNMMQPDWDENGNDAFSVRLQVIEKFVRAGSKVLMRVRAQRRSQKLREALRAAGVTNRASCRAWVEMETKAARSGLGLRAPEAKSGKVAALQDDISKQQVQILPLQIPVAVSTYVSEERQPVEVAPLDNFEEFPYLDINVRLDYKVLSYEKFVAPPPSAYMRPKSSARLEAALEERLIRGPRGGAADAAETMLAMPDSFLLPPAHDALSLLIPSTDCRTFVGFPEASECDTAYRLSRLPSFIGPMTTEPLLPTGIMSLETPWMACWRKPRDIADPFQYFDPMPPSFAEAGGSMGPRLGSDIGGMCLNFLPVSGFDRDLPSDTDDDDPAELAIPAPGAAECAAAIGASLGAALQSVLWDKMQGAEAHLTRLCKTQSSAVRSRLSDLNKDLSFANKLYVG